MLSPFSRTSSKALNFEEEEEERFWGKA